MILKVSDPLLIQQVVNETEIEILFLKNCMEVEKVGPSNLPLRGSASGSIVKWQFPALHFQIPMVFIPRPNFSMLFQVNDQAWMY